MVDLPNFTTVFWWLSLIPGSGFRLKKEVTEGNSEDSREGDPEEIQQGNNLDEEPKDKYETSVHN